MFKYNNFHRFVIFAYSLYFFNVQDISYYDSRKLFTAFQIFFFYVARGKSGNSFGKIGIIYLRGLQEIRLNRETVVGKGEI